jgi:hypothetical protein
MGIKYFAFYEIQGMGMQWYNMALSPVEGDEFSLVQVIVMLLIDCIIYATLTWYIEHVHPGQNIYHVKFSSCLMLFKLIEFANNGLLV